MFFAKVQDSLLVCVGKEQSPRANERTKMKMKMKEKEKKREGEGEKERKVWKEGGGKTTLISQTDRVDVILHSVIIRDSR